MGRGHGTIPEWKSINGEHNWEIIFSRSRQMSPDFFCGLGPVDIAIPNRAHSGAVTFDARGRWWICELTTIRGDNKRSTYKVLTPVFGPWDGFRSGPMNDWERVIADALLKQDKRKNADTGSSDSGMDTEDGINSSGHVVARCQRDEDRAGPSTPSTGSQPKRGRREGSPARASACATEAA